MGRFSEWANAPYAYVTALLFCEDIIDHEDGFFTLVKPFDQIDVPSFPALFSCKLYIAIARAESEDVGFYHDIKSPDGRVVVEGAFAIDWEDRLEVQAVLSLVEIKFTTTGRHLVRVMADDRVLIERHLIVQSPAALRD